MRRLRGDLGTAHSTMTVWTQPHGKADASDSRALPCAGVWSALG